MRHALALVVAAVLAGCLLSPATGVSITLPSGEDLIRSGIDLRFEAAESFGDPSTIRWDFGDGRSAEGNGVSHRYGHGGLYNVVLRVDAEQKADFVLGVGHSLAIHGSAPARVLPGDDAASRIPIAVPERATIVRASLESAPPPLAQLNVRLEGPAGVVPYTEARGTSRVAFEAPVPGPGEYALVAWATGTTSELPFDGLVVVALVGDPVKVRPG